METTLSKTELFRQEFRETVPESYSGLRHASIIVIFGLAMIGVCLALITSPVNGSDFVLVPVVVIAWNWFEWWGHKQLHRPGKSAFSRALYKRHALTHHRFFTNQDTSMRDSRDLKIVFFPVFVLPFIVLLTLIPALLVFFLVSRNAALIFIISTVLMYLLFEFFHLCAHLPDSAWVTRVPIISTMCRHHQAHHDPALMMTTNMNFTLPWADWYFSSCDLDRGFWGTMFNGKSRQFLRKVNK